MKAYTLSAVGRGEFSGSTFVTGSLRTTGSFDVTGTIKAGGDVFAYFSSDERLKTNITLIENATDKLRTIGGYNFDWIPVQGVHENKGHDIGVIAQEIEKVAPEAVTTRANGYKAVNYEKLVPMLIEVNKELLRRIEKLEEQLQ